MEAVFTEGAENSVKRKVLSPAYTINTTLENKLCDDQNANYEYATLKKKNRTRSSGTRSKKSKSISKDESRRSLSAKSKPTEISPRKEETIRLQTQPNEIDDFSSVEESKSS